MSQLQSERTLEVRLTPLAIADAPPTGVSVPETWGPVETDPNAPELPISLCLCPGESSELLIHLHNHYDRALPIALRVSGEFPTQWCQARLEAQTLGSHQKIDAIARFTLPDDFFEQRQAITPETTLTLDFSGQVEVYVRDPERSDLGSLLASKPFRLHARPRSLYPTFLPAVYREVDFIGRLMKIFEQSFEPAVETLQLLWAYLDPLTAPEALLPFLAGWVGWPSDGPWELSRQRRLIRQAMQLYRWRGTKKGMQLYLHLYTNLPCDDHHINIQDRFHRGFILGDTDLGQTAIVGGGRPLHFVVRLRSPSSSTPPLDERLIRMIIEQEKPAFCTYDLYLDA